MENIHMSEHIFISLGIILGIVLITMGIMKFFRQPMIIAYIVAGIVISIFLPSVLQEGEAITSFSNIGISFLLFMVGMELNPRIIKELGRNSFLAGFLQVLITSAVGFGIARGLGCEPMTAIYIGTAFSFSSTIVVLKLLSDKGDTESTHGRLSIGVLIVQDIIVLLVFLAIATINNFETQNAGIVIGTLLLKIVGLGIAVYVCSQYIIPKISQKIAESQEFLFLFAIGRCMIMGALFHYLGLGMEFGTLIAGVALSGSTFKYEITSKIRSLRDFFIVMYFVLLGSQVNFAGGSKMIPVVILGTIFVLVIKPILTMIIFSRMGHTKKNNFLAGTALGQISEFSFLLISMGIAAGHLKNNRILASVTIIGLLSIGVSSYNIVYGEKIYLFLKKWIKYVPGIRKKENTQHIGRNHNVLLFGYGKFGSNVYETLSKQNKNILVIDERPSIIRHLKSKNITCRYGDAGDIDFLEELDLKGTKMIISTIKKFDENMTLLKTCKTTNPKLIVILLSNHIQESIKLYEEGADDVIMPHYIGAHHTSLMLEEFGFDLKKYLENRETQIHELKNRHKDLMIETLQGEMS